MPENEKDNLGVQVAELRADVRHLQSDVTDIKTDLREVRTEVRTEIRSANQKIDQVNSSLASAKVWALVLYGALAGTLLYVMARGFKWL